MERFWSKVDKTDECWLWTAAKTRGGYGHFRLDGKMRRAHRVAYELIIGPIPDGMQLDHLCQVRHCVNPAHLEPVTQKENMRRGSSAEVTKARHQSKTHCPRGHEYAGDNLYVRSNGSRKCRACYRMGDRRA